MSSSRIHSTLSCYRCIIPQHATTICTCRQKQTDLLKNTIELSFADVCCSHRVRSPCIDFGRRCWPCIPTSNNPVSKSKVFSEVRDMLFGSPIVQQKLGPKEWNFNLNSKAFIFVQWSIQTKPEYCAQAELEAVNCMTWLQNGTLINGTITFSAKISNWLECKVTGLVRW